MNEQPDDNNVEDEISNDLEVENAMAAIKEGLMQTQRGEGTPMEEFFAEFESRHGL